MSQFILPTALLYAATFGFCYFAYFGQACGQELD